MGVTVDAALVARRVAEEFPEWSDLPVEPLLPGGHDNRTFRLGEELVVRVPSGRAYAGSVATEARWLPALEPHLPLPIPAPVATAGPSHELPWAWSVRRWLPGESADVAPVDDPVRFATDLAGFLAALRRAPADGAPEPGPANCFRGAPLAVYAGEARTGLEDLADAVERRAAEAALTAALASEHRAAPGWLHGDVAAGNLLVRDGRLSAVIDFGQLASGDPACDVAIAWSRFEGDARDAFLRELAVDAEERARARGWALWKALLGLRGTDGADPSAARRVIDAVLAD